MINQHTLVCVFLLCQLSFVHAKSQLANYKPSQQTQDLITHQKKFLSVNNDSSIIMGLKALNAIEENDYNRKAEVLFYLGQAYDLSGDLHESLQQYKLALDALKESNDLSKIAEIYNEIGTIQRYFTNFEASLDSHLRALSFFEELGDSSGISASLNNIGLVYRNIGDIPNAIDYYKRAISIRKVLRDLWGLSESFNNIGSAYWYLKDYSQALEYYNKSLEIKEVNHLKGLEGVLNNIGNTYREKGDVERAKSFYQRSIEMSRIKGNEKMICITVKNMGILSSIEGKYSKSLNQLNEAYAIAVRVALNRVVTEILFRKAGIFEKLGNSAEALKFYKKYNAVRDSFYNTVNTGKVDEYIWRYEIDKKEKEIRGLRISRQQYTTLFLLVVISALIVISIILYRRFKLKSMMTERLMSKKNIITQSKMELELVNKELLLERNNALESDKLKSEFLAQVSHEIRSPINTILNYTSLIELDFEEYLDENSQGYFTSINNASSRLIRTIDLILNMSELEIGSYKENIRKLRLVNLILDPIILEHKNAAYNKGLSLEFKNLLPGEVEIRGDDYTLSQVFSNLIDNAIKYTHKGKIEVVVSVEDDKLAVAVNDTGIGISKEYLPKLFEKFSQEEQGYTRRYEGSGLGLALVQKYCKVNNARIDVVSKKNEGSSFKVVFMNEYNII